MLDRTNIIPVANETVATSTRVTVGGRQLTYRLNVLQQPIRARACGAGAKSSADRRPVDPPPIVELKIFEGPGEENDVTFNMHATYLLFITLEQARPIAHGRVPEDKTQVPALAGTNVAGIVYLDRPKAAGYFIFPDLSVRHEGVYRLSFSLFEGVKDPKDADRDMPMSSKIEPDSITHRVEVKSEPFTVYSAKKFPGLTESTSLSRMVAEQGCRVRIRRDVRMRRRDTKGGAKDWDDYEDDTAQGRNRSPSPEAPQYGQPQMAQPYPDQSGRVPSISSAGQPPVGLMPRPVSQHGPPSHYQSYPTPVAPQQDGFASSRNGPPPPVPAYPQSQPSYMGHQQPMMPHHPSQPPQYHQQQYQQSPTTTMPQNGYSSYSSIPPPAQHMAQPQYGAPHQPYEHDSRRSSMIHHPPPSNSMPPSSVSNQPPPSYSSYSGHSGYRNSSSSQGSNATSAPSSYYASEDNNSARALPPQPVQPPTHATGSAMLSQRPSLAFTLPPIQTDMASRVDAPSPATSVPQSSYYSTDSHKRNYGSAFNERNLSQSLRDGARPMPKYDQQTSGLGNGDGQGPDLDPSTLRYRRADGRPVARSMPQHA